MSNLLDRLVCPKCEARASLKQCLVETVCREAVVTELCEYGVDEIDESTVTVEPVDGYVEETFLCARCGFEFGSLADLKHLLG